MGPRMKPWHPISLFVLLAGTVVFCADQPGTIADLQPELREALAHDAACKKPLQVTASAPDNVLNTPVQTQEIHVAGRPAGVIVEPRDTCHCQGENCTTYVYIKQAENYKLALAVTLTSLHPMKITKHGLPSLTGKLQLNEAEAETTVYDWNGREYLPSLCATIRQRKNQRLPAIAAHQCSRIPKRDEPQQAAAIRPGS